MKLRLAKKILRNAIETGVEPRGSTLWRAVAAFPRGKRMHPRSYITMGMTAAFLRLGYSINVQRMMIAGWEFDRRMEGLGAKR